MFYNYFRDYDPVTGRYVESDPIGLKGGSLSTYGYVDNDPVDSADRFGLQSAEVGPVEEMLEQLPPSIRQNNRWNDPDRQPRAEFPGGTATVSDCPETSMHVDLCGRSERGFFL